MKQEKVEIPWESGSQTPASHRTHQQPQIGEEGVEMLDFRLGGIEDAPLGLWVQDFVNRAPKHYL